MGWKLNWKREMSRNESDPFNLIETQMWWTLLKSNCPYSFHVEGIETWKLN